MERITSFGGSVFRRKNRDKKVGKQKKVTSRFSSILDSLETGKEESIDFLSISEDHPLESILDDIHELGEELKEKPSLKTISDYKKAVRGFMQYVVKQSMGVEEKVSGVNILKRKRFTLIKIIDEKLERLAAQILENQKDQLDILQRVDEINGLLVDLVR
jgi:uncharacterized protein YaaR (DUF327 family)